MNFNFSKELRNFELRYSRELGLPNITIGEILDETIFTTEIENVKNYLSHYGTLFNGDTFYYDDEIFSYYDEIQQQQIIICEMLNFFGLYHTANRKLNDYNREVIRSENLFYLSCMGLTKFVSAGTKIRHQLVPYYIKKHGELDVILFAPTANSLEYLFNQMIQGYEGITKFLPGYRIENEKYSYIDSYGTHLDGGAGSRGEGISCCINSRYDHDKRKTFYSHRIYVYDKNLQKLTKKSSEEYGEFIDAIEMMRRLTEF